MLEVDDKQIKQLTANLKEVSKSAFPLAVRSTLNKMAFEAANQIKKNVKQRFVVRNASSNIVLKSIRFSKCDNTFNIDSMESFAGQGATTFGKPTDQLKKQEFGETIQAGGKYLYKATKFSRGGSYKRIVRQANYLTKLDIKKIDDIAANPIHATTPEQVNEQIKQVVGVAHHTHKTINFLPDGKTTQGKFGVIQVKDTKTKINKKGKKAIVNKSGKLIYSIHGDSQILKPAPTISPAGQKVAAASSEIFIKEAERRIDKVYSKGLNKT